MDTVTLSKQNRLFWLGRYAERVYTTTQYMMKQYDHLIDGGTVDYGTFCQKMGIPCVYDSGDDFCRRYLFDSTSPYSVQSGVEAMLGNGMVLRETITSPTLAYLQMAHSAMELAARSEAPGVELQWVLDDIMAFRGSCEETIEEESSRNIIKTGASLERVDVCLRLGAPESTCEKEFGRLFNRLYNTALQPDRDRLNLLVDAVLDKTAPTPDAAVRVQALEGLFPGM